MKPILVYKAGTRQVTLTDGEVVTVLIEDIENDSHIEEFPSYPFGIAYFHLIKQRILELEMFDAVQEEIAFKSVKH